jgi:hypothetical protein
LALKSKKDIILPKKEKMSGETIKKIIPEVGMSAVPVNVLGELADEHYHGPQEFEMIVDYGQSFEPLRDSVVPVDQRWTSPESLQDTGNRVEVLSFDYPDCAGDLRFITAYANLQGKPAPAEDPEARSGYQETLQRIYRPLVADIETRLIGGEEIIGIAILNGGLLMQEFYNLPSNSRGQIQEKRLDYSRDGQTGMGLGISDLVLPKQLSEFNGRETLLVYEDCTATGISGMGFLYHLKDLQDNKGLKFGKVELHFAAATQQGIQNILRVADELGINIVIKTANVVYALNEKFYLTRTPEEVGIVGFHYKGNEEVVGDMGAFAAPLPPEFNDRCPWNKKRVS